MKTRHKVAAGGLAAGTIALAAAMYNHWEGRNYVAVHLAFDPPGVVTVCGGITTHDIPTLKVGDRYSEADCEKLIERVVPKYAAPLQECIPTFNELPPHRAAALISFSINLGPKVACGTVASLINAGRIKDACQKMTEYVLANGRRLQGLVNRRNDPVWGEKAWCLRED
jgi:lysozyme